MMDCENCYWYAYHSICRVHSPGDFSQLIGSGSKSPELGKKIGTFIEAIELSYLMYCDLFLILWID